MPLMLLPQGGRGHLSDHPVADGAGESNEGGSARLPVLAVALGRPHRHASAVCCPLLTLPALSVELYGLVPD